MLSVFQQVFGDVPAARWREWGRDRQQRGRHLRQHQPQAQAVCLQVKHIKSTKHEHDETEGVVEFATTALDLLHLVKSLPSESAFPLSSSGSNFKSFTRNVLSPLSPLHYFHIIVKYSSWCFVYSYIQNLQIVISRPNHLMQEQRRGLGGRDHCGQQQERSSPQVVVDVVAVVVVAVVVLVVVLLLSLSLLLLLFL